MYVKLGGGGGYRSLKITVVTLHAKFMALSYAWLSRYSTNDKIGYLPKLTITKAVRPNSLKEGKNGPVFYCSSLSFSWLFLQKKNFGSKQSTYLWSQIFKITPNSEINGLVTLHAAFLSLLYAWLIGIVLMMNNIGENLMNYQNGPDSFTIVNQCQIDHYLSSYLLPLVDCFPLCFDIQIMKKWQLWIGAIYLVVWHIIQKDTQQWYQWPCQLARHVLGLIPRLTV